MSFGYVSTVIHQETESRNVVTRKSFSLSGIPDLPAKTAVLEQRPHLSAHQRFIRLRYWKGDQGKVSKLGSETAKRSIVSDCCYRTCSLADLEQYCATGDGGVRFASFFFSLIFPPNRCPCLIAHGGKNKFVKFLFRGTL